MIGLVVERPTPRLAYAAELIFDVVLGVPYALVPREEYLVYRDQALALGFYFINYCREPLDGVPRLPVAGLLDHAVMVKLEPQVRQTPTGPVLFPTEDARAADGPLLLDFDPLSAAFYVATEYPAYFADRFDEHGRYLPETFAHYRPQTEALPVIHHWADQLYNALPDDVTVTMPRYQRPFDYRITVDVDQPFDYLHRPQWRHWAATLRDTARGRMQNVRERWQALRTGHDPADTFGLLHDCLPVESVVYFFLLSTATRHDSRYGADHPAVRELIQALQGQGYRVGVHPGYGSATDWKRIQADTQALADILGQPVVRARQHFLQYRIPDTYRVYERLGIRHDYTTVSPASTGFRHGLAVPFPWFDLRDDRRTELVLHPTHVMDRTLLSYLNMSPEEAGSHVCEIIDRVRAVGGRFTLLLHNQALSDTGEWHGWRDTWLTIFSLLHGLT